MGNDEKVLKNLGNRLKKAREAAKMTQSDVAKAADINVNYYAQIERGEINTSYEKLQSIAKALNLKSIDIS
jgi:transcriptional regulator with XRE-family HTH domain